MVSFNSHYRHLIAVIGEAGAQEGDPAYILAEETGKLLVDCGFRVCSGGLGGVMSAVFQGARRSTKYREGDTVAIIPVLDHRRANPFADIVIATGLGHLRNGIVAAAEAVLVIGGKAGTLSEMALAWRYNRLLVALSASGGVAAQYAGKALDNRRSGLHPALTSILKAQTSQEAVDLIHQNISDCYIPPDSFKE